MKLLRVPFDSNGSKRSLRGIAVSMSAATSTKTSEFTPDDMGHTRSQIKPYEHQHDPHKYPNDSAHPNCIRVRVRRSGNSKSQKT